MEPITPAASRKVKRMLNLPEVFDFTKLFEHEITNGIKLGEVEILFGMIDDETIAAEKSRLGNNH